MPAAKIERRRTEYARYVVTKHIVTQLSQRIFAASIERFGHTFALSLSRMYAKAQ
jgi:hypothetical protein